LVRKNPFLKDLTQPYSHNQI